MFLGYLHWSYGNPHESLQVGWTQHGSPKASPKVRPKSRSGSLAAAECPTGPPWHVRWAQHHPGRPSPKNPLRNLADTRAKRIKSDKDLEKVDHETIGQQNIMLTR